MVFGFSECAVLLSRVGYLKVTKLLATYFLIMLHFHRGPGTREGTQQPPHLGVMLMVMDMHWHSDSINDAF